MDKDIAEEKGKIISTDVREMEPVKDAIKALTDGIVKRFNSPDYVTLAMHVNVNTAKADLIPIPHPNNIMKLQEHFPNLPKKVQDVIKKNTPEPESKALEEIYDHLEKTFKLGNRQLPEQGDKRIEEKIE